ncbi:MAG: hypothetical protein ACJ0Q1_10560 [Luminiphilus sp.]
MTELRHPNSLSRQRKLRRWHRLVALVTSCQLLLWTLSGLYFAFVDIDYVRGHQFKRSPSSTQLDLSSLQTGVVSAKKVVIQERLTGELIVGVQADDGTQWLDEQGVPIIALTPAQALTLGNERTVIKPDQVEWVDTDIPGSEYRGAPLPQWRLWRADDPDRVAYVDAMSGDVTVVRHDAWRWWDFLWSLHIMSYEDRDTIGTWLLRIFSLLALATAVLGVWLFLHTRARRSFQ